MMLKGGYSVSQLSNKSTLYVVMRHDFSGKDVVIAIAKTAEKADNLEGEYTQLYIDKGFRDDEFYFYVVATMFYDS